MEILWAGWRSGYVRSADEMNAEGCLFCGLPEGDDAESLILERGPLAYTVLNRFPYTNGHLMVSPFRHIAGLGDLTGDEIADMWRLLGRAERACRAAMAPHAFNLGANLGGMAGAGVPDHLHLHLVPRWRGDTNFMTAVAATRVVPEDLADTWAGLRAVLAAGEAD